jgi:GT2 family glycosyltransferase
VNNFEDSLKEKVLANTNHPLVSVIILNYNGKRFLDKCLSSILVQSYPNYEVLLVDNNSTDDSVDFVKKNFPKILVVKNHDNVGFAEGTNIGFKNSKGDYLIALNTDTKVKENFISELVDAAESDSKIGSVSCKVVRSDGLVHDGPVFTNHGFVVPWIFLINGFNNYQEACSHYNYNLSNCATATLYRKTVIDQIGGFDQDFWAGWEDFDLGYRINLNGFLSVHTPRTTVFHVGSGSFKGSVNHEIRCLRNRFSMLVKNYESRNMLLRFLPFFIITPVFFFFRTVINELMLSLRILKKSPIRFISRIDFQGCLEFREKYVVFLFGFLTFLSGIKKPLSKRYSIQKLRVTSDKAIFSRTKNTSLT